jgi:dTDP-4-amino-4,6-dideoxygalactose transaminase
MRTSLNAGQKTEAARLSPQAAEAVIPFNRPFIAGRELFYISHAVLHGNLAGDGHFTRLCCQWMEKRFGARRVLLTHSCTAALEMSALLCDIGPGDEVIMPSYTFVSTANAFALRGASIRFVEIRPDTLNIDETKIEEAITARTKAIVPVHYAGVGAEMDTISAIASQYKLRVIEDAAQGVDGTYRGKYLGTLGALGAYSFHETKNVIAGEGGALVVNDEALVDEAEIARDKGTDRSKYFRGMVDKYTWVGLGSSYLASELTAAFLYGQLEAIDSITQKRKAIFDYYRDGLQLLEKEGILQLPACPDECRHNAHMFYVVLPNSRQRDELIRHLLGSNIHAVIHYVPLHSSPMGRRFSAAGQATLPVTDDLSGRLLRLPCYFELERVDQDRVIDAVWRKLAP